MCPRNILKRPEMDMSAGLARRVIDELDAGGISGLWLYNIGESMLHPDFRSLLAYAGGKRRLGSLWLSTNAQELLPENLDSVLTSGLTFLNVSVNAATAGTYRRVSPGGDYARVLENLERLRAAKKSRGMEDSPPWLRLQIIDQPLASGEIDAFLSEFGGLGDVLSVNLLEAFSQNVAANVEHARGRPPLGQALPPPRPRGLLHLLRRGGRLLRHGLQPRALDRQRAGPERARDMERGGAAQVPGLERLRLPRRNPPLQELPRL
jgi:hypothetical protein